MYMFVFEVFTVYIICSHVTCKGEGVYLTRVVSSSLRCASLCAYTTRCGSYTWDAATRSCHLHTPGDTETETMPHAKYLKKSQRMVYRNHQCEGNKVCLPVEAWTKFTRVASTAAPSTTTTTTPSSTPSAATTLPSITPTLTTTKFRFPPAITTTTTPSSTTTTTTQSSTTTTTTPSPSTTITIPSSTTTIPTTLPATTTTTPCPVTVNQANVPYAYVGCYTDDQSRVLPHGYMFDRTCLTTETCKLHCHGLNYIYFGTERGYKCFCGDVIQDGYMKKHDSECNYPCPGDRSTMCGAQGRISIYKIG